MNHRNRLRHVGGQLRGDNGRRVERRVGRLGAEGQLEHLAVGFRHDDVGDNWGGLDGDLGLLLEGVQLRDWWDRERRESGGDHFVVGLGEGADWAGDRAEDGVLAVDDRKNMRLVDGFEGNNRFGGGDDGWDLGGCRRVQ